MELRVLDQSSGYRQFLDFMRSFYNDLTIMESCNGCAGCVQQLWLCEAEATHTKDTDI